MAYIVLNSKFNPFSYEELVKPLREATQVHQATEEQISDLELESGKMEALMNAQSDTKAFNMYRKFNDDLKAQADRLQKEGLTPGTRQEFLKIRGRYGSEIEPIKAASQEYESMMKFRQGLAGKNVIFNNDYSSIDDFLGGRKADNSYVDLDDIQSRIAVQSKILGQSRVSESDPKLILNGQHFEIKRQQGYTPEDISKAFNEDPSADENLKNIILETRANSGYNMRSEQEKAAIDNSIINGLRSSIMAPETQILANRNFQTSADRNAATNADTIAKIKLGYLPYRTDNDGTQHFSNSTREWSVKPDKTIGYEHNLKKVYDENGQLVSTQREKEEEKFASPINLTLKARSYSKEMKSQTPKSFNYDEARTVEFKDMPENLKTDLLKKLEARSKELGLKGRSKLTLEDVTIYKDPDWNADDYRIVRKGFDATDTQMISQLTTDDELTTKDELLINIKE